MQPNTDKIIATNKTSVTTIPTITERKLFILCIYYNNNATQVKTESAVELDL